MTWVSLDTWHLMNECYSVLFSPVINFVLTGKKLLNFDSNTKKFPYCSQKVLSFAIPKVTQDVFLTECKCLCLGIL